MGRAFLFLASSACLFAQQASVEGTAVNSVTHEPLGDVHIRLLGLNSTGISAAYGAISDRDGHFSISTIRPGAYIPVPERSGFLYVQPKAAESRLPNLTLKPGEHRTDWVVEMVPRAVLSGRVLDENGDPVQGVWVQAMPVSPDTAPATMTPFPNLETDDRGEFRIAGAPGKYYLQARPTGRYGNERPEFRGDGSSETAYGVTYYPSSAPKARAAVVEAIAGKDIGGLEIRLQREHGMAINGIVTGIPERTDSRTPVPDVIMQFGEKAQQITGSRTASAGLDGKFSFPGVQPGYYRLWARYWSGKMQLSTRTVELQIEAADPPTVELALMPPIDVYGTLVMEGDPPGQAPPKRAVRLEPASPSAGFQVRPSGGELDPDGAFHIENVAPAKYRVRVEPLPENGFVKSVDVDGAVSAEATVDFSMGRTSRIKVTASRNGAQISGTVLDENGEPMLTPLAMVMLVQDPKDFQDVSTKSVTPDGKYTFNGVRPGKYRLLAVDNFRNVNDTLETLRKLAARGAEIEFKEGDRIHKDLRLLPKEDANAPKH